MQNKNISIHATVSGKVQGVFFRQATLEKATELNLTGWVKNTTDNMVELVASGDRDAIMLLTDWLWEGPSQAQVSNVQWEERPFEKFDTFVIAQK